MRAAPKRDRDPSLRGSAPSAAFLLLALLLPGAGAGPAFAAPPQDPVPGLVSDLFWPDAPGREEAARALARLGPGARDAIDPLIQKLADEDPYVAGAAAEALHRIGSESVLPLSRALGDEREKVRWGAAIALGKLRKQALPALPALVRALADANDDVRYCAAFALGGLGTAAAASEGVVPALVEALHDRDEGVRRAAVFALAQIDPAGRLRDRSWEGVVATVERLVPLLMAEHHVPGVSLALVRDRRVAYTRSWGVADARTGVPVTGETLFEAASMTKPVFAYTVLKLAEQGRLDLDRPLAKPAEAEPIPDQPERALVTARMALSHTTGLPNWRHGDEERDGPLPIAFRPGTRFSYSGEGIAFLQRAVERLTGEPLESYARRTLFVPLGLRQSSYVHTAAVEEKLASGHAADGTFLERSRYLHANAAYTLYTTAPEYARFLVEILKVDRSAAHSLSRGSVDAMLSRQVAVDSREPIERPGKARGLAVSWGLGWSLNSTEQGDIAHHGGSNRTGFRCFSQLSPSRGTGLVILTNGLSGGELWTRLVAAIGDL